MASNREERKLMRQRGAGTRQLIGVTSGFTFGAPSQSLPSSSRTPKRVDPKRSSRKTIRNRDHGTTSKAPCSPPKATEPPKGSPAHFVTFAVTGKRKRGRPPTKAGHGTGAAQEVQDELHADNGAHQRQRTKQKHSPTSGSGRKSLKTVPLPGLDEEDELELEGVQPQVLLKKGENKRGRPTNPREQQAVAQREEKDPRLVERAKKGTSSRIETPAEDAEPVAKETEPETQGTSSLAAEILDVTNSDATQPPLKRKRGRPAKEATLVVERNKAEKQATSCLPAEILDVTTSDVIQPPLKLKRGRPTKEATLVKKRNKSETQATSSLPMETLDVTTSDVTEPPLKRRRGRPRKHANTNVVPPTVLHNVSAAKATMRELVAQGVSREQLPEPKDAVLQQPLRKLENYKQPKDEAPAKRRGRPRKQPVRVSNDVIPPQTMPPGLGEESEQKEASKHERSPAVQPSKPSSHHTGKPAKQDRAEPLSTKETEIKTQILATKLPTLASGPEQARRPLSDRTNTTSLPPNTSSEAHKDSKLTIRSKHLQSRNAISKPRPLAAKITSLAQPTGFRNSTKLKATHGVKRLAGHRKIPCPSESGSDTDELSSARYPPIPSRGLQR